MERLVQLVAYQNWIIGVSRTDGNSYFCWVITPEAVALNDGEHYPSVYEAMKSGRQLVLSSVD